MQGHWLDPITGMTTFPGREYAMLTIASLQANDIKIHFEMQ